MSEGGRGGGLDEMKEKPLRRRVVFAKDQATTIQPPISTMP